MKIHLLSFICILLLSACSNSLVPAKTATALNGSDQKLISVACESSIYALRIAEAGTLRSAAHETKQLAEKSLENHKMILSQLSEIAGSKGIALPSDINLEESKPWKEMVTQKGSLFDRSFIELCDKQNNYVLDIFTYISKRAKDADVRRAAKEILAYTSNPQNALADTQVSVAKKSSTSSTIKTTAYIP
ncbi:MAG TPA: DUF4142 domain-containing protein [Segetibacter sp.]|jgi:predicted outer membrane protein